FTLASLGTFTRSGGTVNVTGTLNNAGTTLALDATTGSWNLAGGTVSGGTVALQAGGPQLVMTSAGGTLAGGVTINGNLDLTASGANVSVTGGLTLNGTATLGANARIYLHGRSPALG